MHNRAGSEREKGTEKVWEREGGRQRHGMRADIAVDADAAVR